jgi:hypothetical protein
MADSKNREAARDALTALLEASFGPSGDGTAQAVLNYTTVDLAGQTPVVMVFSAGTNRPNREGFGSDSYFATEARLGIAVYVALPKLDEANYTHQDAEDLVDELDKKIADVIIANNTLTGTWMSLRYEEGFSLPIDVEMPAGGRYIEERFFVIAKLR